MRLFIAVAADEDAKAAAGGTIARLRASADGYRWVDPRDMHTTLRFLGETPEERLPEVEALMRRAAAAAAPFELTYGALGAFDSIDDPRVVWLGVSRGAAELERLALLLERDEPRPFTPHLTLGRRKGDASPAAFVAAIRAEPEAALTRPVTRISLYASRPAPFGHAYQILSEAELTGRP